jgi:rod shape-determining protein MreD
MLQRIMQVIGILICVTLQVVLGQWLGYAAPELVLAVVMAVSLAGDVAEAVMWAAIGGLLLDLLLGSMPGFYLISFGLVAILLIAVTRQVLHRPPWTVAIIVFVIIAVIIGLIMSSLVGSLSWWILLSGLTTALVATISYFYLSVIAKRQEVIQLG